MDALIDAWDRATVHWEHDLAPLEVLTRLLTQFSPQHIRCDYSCGYQVRGHLLAATLAAAEENNDDQADEDEEDDVHDDDDDEVGDDYDDDDDDDDDEYAGGIR